MHMGGLRDEIDQVEAANVPLPLAQDDQQTEQSEGTSGSGFSPLGPL